MTASSQAPRLANLQKYNPLMSEVHVDAVSTDFAVAYTQALEGFVHKAFPSVPVSKQSGYYFEHLRAAWNRLQAGKRAPGTETPGGNYRMTTGTYTCDVWGIHKDTPVEVIQQADAPLDVERSDAEWCAYQMALGKEYDFFTNCLAKASQWNSGTDWAGGAATSGSTRLYWNRAGSAPILDVATGAAAIRKNTGKKPNTLVLGATTALTLQNNADVISRFPGSTEVTVAEDNLARLFRVERVLIADSAYAAAVETAADTTHTMTTIFDKSAWLGYVDPNPGVTTQTALMCLEWQGLRGATDGMSVAKYEDWKTHQVRTEAMQAWVWKMTCSDCGLLLGSIVE